MPQELEKLKEIIITIPVDDDDKLKEEGLEIINKLGRDHINDELTIDKNKKGTILGCLILCDSQNGVRLNNSTLKELENAITQLGGKLKISEHDTGADQNLILEILLGREDPIPRSSTISASDLEFASTLRQESALVGEVRIENIRSRLSGLLELALQAQNLNLNR